MNNNPNNIKEKSPIKVSNNASMGVNDCEDEKFAEFNEDKMILDLLMAPMSP